ARVHDGVRVVAVVAADAERARRMTIGVLVDQAVHAGRRRGGIAAVDRAVVAVVAVERRTGGASRRGAHLGAVARVAVVALLGGRARARPADPLDAAAERAVAVL